MAIKPKSHGRLSIGASTRPRDLIEERPSFAGAWTANVLTLYPDMFPGTLGQSLLGRALDKGIWSLNTVNIRDFAPDKHHTVDDTPAGGGAGMVMKPDVLARAIDSIASPAPRICLSPRGRPFTQDMAASLASGPGLTLLCGRFEGIDARVLEARGIQEVSIGDYVLTGGEIAAQVLIDACLRLIPRVLGNADSAVNESFTNGLLEHPQYTRPTEWEGRTIPEVLLSGHHAQIAAWRHAQSEATTKERRPDLWRAYLERRDTDPIEDQELSEGPAQNARERRKTDDEPA